MVLLAEKQPSKKCEKTVVSNCHYSDLNDAHSQNVTVCTLKTSRTVKPLEMYHGPPDVKFLLGYVDRLNIS